MVRADGIVPGLFRAVDMPGPRGYGPRVPGWRRASASVGARMRASERRQAGARARVHTRELFKLGTFGTIGTSKGSEREISCSGLRSGRAGLNVSDLCRLA